MQVFGILNLSADSFSDGGVFADPSAALRHAEAMLAAGAHGIDVGAEASNPSAARLDAKTEIARLAPVVGALTKTGARVSIDTYKAEVMQAMIDLGASMVNDITALADPAAAPVLAKAPHVQVVLMHARNVTHTGEPHANREKRDVGGLVDEILAFFTARVAFAAAAGLDRTRLILDPGMGMFLDAKSEASVMVLDAIPRLKALGLPVYISTSRKSFISALLGGGREPMQRAYGTLATELFALDRGADYLRTHDPRAILDAWTVWQKLRGYSGSTNTKV